MSGFGLCNQLENGGHFGGLLLEDGDLLCFAVMRIDKLLNGNTLKMAIQDFSTRHAVLLGSAVLEWDVMSQHTAIVVLFVVSFQRALLNTAEEKGKRSNDKGETRVSRLHSPRDLVRPKLPFSRFSHLCSRMTLKRLQRLIHILLGQRIIKQFTGHKGIVSIEVHKSMTA